MRSTTAYPAMIASQVALKNHRKDRLVSAGPPDWPGLQEQQHPTSEIGVSVVTSTDVLHEIVAERHFAKRALPAYLLVCQSLDFARYIKRPALVRQISLAIDQQNPIDVAGVGDFEAAHRSKHHN
jgi:hypothetical protein